MSVNPIFSYTNRSIETSRAEGMKKIPIISRGDWTDLNATDPGMILLDYVHALVDMVQFYQDHNALESFLSTAKERVNIFRLAKQLSYNIRSAKGSKVDVEFYLKGNSLDATIKIPMYTALYTSTGIYFLTTEDAYINAGEIAVTVPCVQGEINIETYTGTGISRYSNVEDAKDQVFKLGPLNIDIDSIEVIDNLNRIWEPVEFITFTDSTDRVYQKILNPDGTVSIQFGNGERGVVPESTDVFTIQYIYSKAEEGRTGKETIINIEDTIFDINGNPVEIFVTNYESTSGGSGPQSDEEIVDRAPGAIKAQGRAVTLSDFESLAKLIDGVADAKAYDINTDDSLYPYEVRVIIIPEEGSSVNNSLIKQVYDYLYERMIPPTNLQVLPPNEYPISITVDVIRNPAYKEGGLEYSIKEAIEGYFNDRYGILGESFNPEELKSIIARVPGVRYVSSMTPSEMIDISSNSVIRLLGDPKINVN